MKDLESQGAASAPRSVAGSVRSSKGSARSASSVSAADDDDDDNDDDSGTDFNAKNAGSNGGEAGSAIAGALLAPGSVPMEDGEGEGTRLGRRDSDAFPSRASATSRPGVDRPASPAAATAGTHVSGPRDLEDRDPLEADDESLWHVIDEGLPRCDVAEHGDSWIQHWASRGGAGSWFDGVHGGRRRALAELELDSAGLEGDKSQNQYGLQAIVEAPSAPLRPDPVAARAISEIRSNNRRRWTGRHGRFSSTSAGFQPVVALGYDSRMLLHDEIPKRKRPLIDGMPVPPIAPHPERSDRLRGIAGHLAATGLWQRCWRVPTREARREECELVHTS